MECFRAEAIFGGRLGATLLLGLSLLADIFLNQ